MRAFTIALLFAATAAAGPAPLFSTATDAAWKKWEAVRGSVQLDSGVKRDGRPALRIDGDGSGDARVRSLPVSLRLGKPYELSGWIKTDGLAVRDLDRSPIGIGAALSMESMPFDVHSESVGGTRDWSRFTLRFVASRSQDSIVLTVATGGAFSGKAWFDGVTLDQASSAGAWPAKGAVTSFGPAYRYPASGWIYLHIEGSPYERGYQHGFLMPHEIEGYLDRCAAQLDRKSRERAWNNGRTMADALFLRGFDEEILQEMKGIADGATAGGARYNGRIIDLTDIVLANTIVEIGELNSAVRMTPTGLEGLGLQPPSYLQHKGDVPVTARCSAFAATGKATRDGHMIIAHTTWWPLTLSEQTNVMLDIQPAKGHRMLIQSYPGGIESGTDWYQNDAGVILTETTIRQSPFNREGTPVAYRARKAIQYGDSIDKVVEYLSVKNNGLYTNEWIIGDAKTDEIAMLELGTYKTRLYRSSKNDWFGGTEGFYWGCNNAKDLAVRLEYAVDPKGAPQHLPFTPDDRDLKWQEMYRRYKGSIDEQFAFLAFRTAPLVSSAAMDAKVVTGEMASNLMVWAVIGKPNQREWVPSRWEKDYEKNDGLYSGGYRLFSARPSEAFQAMLAEPAPAASKPEAKSEEKKVSFDKAKLWNGWILPASDADLWLSAGSAAYYRAMSSDDLAEELNVFRAEFRAAAIQSDTPLSQLRSDPSNGIWARIARRKGALLLDALRLELGDDRFLALMKDFFAANTTKTVTSASFRAAAAKSAGKSLDAFFDQWLNAQGLPGDRAGAAYVAASLSGRLGSAIIVYGTNAEEGANRYAAEQLQKEFLNWFESAAPIRKDFELTEADLRTHDVVFVGRPESNSALAAIAAKLGLKYEGGAFEIEGVEHPSEYEALVLGASNPLDAHHMVVVIAGNSPLQTVKTVQSFPPDSEYAIYRDGKETASGFRSAAR